MTPEQFRQMCSQCPKSLKADQEVLNVSLHVVGDLRRNLENELVDPDTVLVVGELVLPDHRDLYFRHIAALLYGAVEAYVLLVNHSLEREALNMQRHVLEYFYRVWFFATHPLESVFDRFETLLEKWRHTKKLGPNHGSKIDYRELAAAVQQFGHAVTHKNNPSDAEISASLAQIRKETGVRSVPSIEAIASEHGTEDVYNLYYAGPSKIAHGSLVVSGYSLKQAREPKFDSRIASINLRSCIVANYALETTSLIMRYVGLPWEQQASAYRKRLVSVRRRLKIKQ